MNIADILTPHDVICSLVVGSKKQALQELAKHASNITNVPTREIFNTLLQRERLGSTGIGNSIAIPHAKLEGINKIHGVFARLAKPIDFDSADDQQVDLLFLLIVPIGAGADHLKALTRITTLLRNLVLIKKLRAADDSDSIYSLLAEHHTTSNAA
jgi:PTS system nitrogen regulatory IIA component